MAKKRTAPQDELPLNVEGDSRRKASGPVTCLGMTFKDDDERRAHFTELLRAKLKDPAFRKIEGFPIGSDDDIIAMSDPPYYTACPNPFLDDFVKHHGKPYDRTIPYSRKPFAVDVSEGKTDPLYKAHSYHTKVPHLAIVPSILHYTEPGDLVLDGFCGTGMTGVAAQWCGCAPPEYRQKVEAEWKAAGWDPPKWGSRRAILNDLSPIATFIAANYNLPFDVEEFAQAGRQLLDEVEAELGWMYETLHTDGKTKGRIEYTVWSEVFACPNCQGEIVFLDEALDPKTKRVAAEFNCPHCDYLVGKKRGKSKSKTDEDGEDESDGLIRVFENKTDPATGEPWKKVKFRPSLINYKVGKATYQKKLDEADLKLLEKIEKMPFPAEVPTTAFPIDQMYHGSRIAPKGFTHIHHFFLPRAAHSLAALWRKAKAHTDQRTRQLLELLLDSHVVNLSIRNRYRPDVSFPYNPLTGVYYIGSLISEALPFTAYTNKINRMKTAVRQAYQLSGYAAIQTGTAAEIGLRTGTVDYIFTDPPFGENIYYADLNWFVEAWHRVQTQAAPEAIIDRHKKKALTEYESLMEACFKEYFRVLKPGRWMTVVFHNSNVAVRHSVNIAMENAGFVVADVRTLDKIQGSYRQVTSSAMKQDLVISAYKPNGGLEERFLAAEKKTDGIWLFIDYHLKQLPLPAIRSGRIEPVAGRTVEKLHDQMAAHYFYHGLVAPLTPKEFQQDLALKYPERDGMYFLPDQVAAYDKLRMQVNDVGQLELFVTDEASAIQWLRQELKERPQTTQELTTKFLREISKWEKHERSLELRDLLFDNFIKYDGKGEVPSQIHAYLSTNWPDLRKLPKDDPRLQAKAKDRWYVPDPNKEADLEKVRLPKLLREFWTYLPEGYTPSATVEGSPQMELLPKTLKKRPTAKKLKIVRLEAVRTGFKHCWAQKDYDTILVVGDRLPGDVLEEDEKLLRWYQMAKTRSGEDE